MNKIFLIFLIFVVLVGGCLESATVNFKECRLDYDRINENRVAKLWIEIENSGDFIKEVEVKFVYPEEVTIEDKGKRTEGFNVTIDPNGATSGRKSFNVYGDYVEGQPSSPWEIKVQMYVGKEMVKEKTITLTVLPSD